MANIPGTSNRDTIYGTNFDDILNRDGDPFSYPGTAGNDAVYGLGGNDRLYGGLNDDALFGGEGHDELFGGVGTDYLVGDNGNDRLDGGTGADRMYGGAGHDTYVVDDVNDRAFEYSNDGGVDSVVTSVRHEMGFGIEHLVMTGSAPIESVGNDLANYMFGNEANNRLYGWSGNDQLYGSDGNDELNGEAGNDELNGGTGVDTASYSGVVAGVTVNLSLTTAQNTVGAGTDLLQGIENLTGSSFNDSLTGNSGNNVLTGGSGNDTLSGGNGNDTLIGGSGRDQLNGGAGNDRFDFNAVSESVVGTSRDVITGFAGAGTALGDQIDLRDIDANTLVTGNQAFTYIGSAAFTAAGQLRYSGGILQGSTDGDTAAEFEIQLVGTPALSVGGTGTDILL